MESRKKKDNLLIKHSDVLTCFGLSDTRFGKLMKAVVRYNIDGTTPTDFDPELATMFKFFKTTTDGNNAEYQRVSEERSRSGKKGGKANQANQANQANAKFAKKTENQANQANQADMMCSDMMCSDMMCSDMMCSDKTFSNEKALLEKTSPIGDEKKSPQKRGFVKPTLDEIRGYCSEKGYGFDPEAFVAFYESNGWRVSRNPMRDWRMACVTWQKKFEEDRRRDEERRSRFGGAPQQQAVTPERSPFPDEYSDEEWNRLTPWEHTDAIHRHFGID